MGLPGQELHADNGGHHGTNNVLFAVAHPNLPIMINGSENGSGEDYLERWHLPYSELCAGAGAVTATDIFSPAGHPQSMTIYHAPCIKI